MFRRLAPLLRAQSRCPSVQRPLASRPSWTRQYTSPTVDESQKNNSARKSEPRKEANPGADTPRKDSDDSAATNAAVEKDPHGVVSQRLYDMIKASCSVIAIAKSSQKY